MSVRSCACSNVRQRRASASRCLGRRPKGCGLKAAPWLRLNLTIKEYARRKTEGGLSAPRALGRSPRGYLEEDEKGNGSKVWQKPWVRVGRTVANSVLLKKTFVATEPSAVSFTSHNGAAQPTRHVAARMAHQIDAKIKSLHSQSFSSSYRGKRRAGRPARRSGARLVIDAISGRDVRAGTGEAAYGKIVPPAKDRAVVIVGGRGQDAD